MAEDIIDIVTRLSYQVQSGDLKKTIDDFNALTVSIDKNKQKLQELQRYEAQNSQQEAQKQDAIEKTTKLIDIQTAAYEKKAKLLTAAASDEIGRITQLKEVITQLTKEQATLTDPTQIRTYTKDIATVTAQLKDLLAPKDFAVLGILDKLQNRLSIINATTKTLTNPTDIARANQEADRVRAQISNVNELGRARQVPGIIGQINQQIAILNKQLPFAKTEQDVANINKELDGLNSRLKNLKNAGLEQDVKSNGIFGNIFAIGANPGAQVLQGILTGLGVGGGFGIITRLTSELVEVGSQFLQSRRSVEEFDKAVQDLNKNLVETINNITSTNIGLQDFDFSTLSSEAHINALKREADAIKARGVVSGEVYQSERAQAEAQRAINQQTVSDIDEQIKAYKSLRDNARVLRGLGSTTDQASVLKEITDNVKLQNRIATQLQPVRDENGRFTRPNAYNLATEELNKLETQRKDAQQKADDDDLEFTSKHNEAEYQLNLSLNERVLKSNEDFEKKAIDNKQDANGERLGLIQRQIEIERESAIRQVDNELKLAEKAGTLSNRNLENFNDLRNKIQASYDLQFLRAQRDFLFKKNAQDAATQVALNSGELAQSGFDIANSPASVDKIQENIRLQNEVALDEFYKGYTARYEALRQSNLDVQEQEKQRSLLDQQFANDFVIVQEKATQRSLQIYLDYYSKLQQQATKGIGDIISNIDKDLAEKNAAISDKYLNGSISAFTLKYRQNLNELQSTVKTRQEALVQAQRQLPDAYSTFDKTKAASDAVYANPNATAVERFSADQSLQSASQAIQDLEKKVADLNNQLSDAEAKVDQKRKDNFQKQIGLLNDLVSATAQAYNQISSIQQASLDREISIREDRVRQAERLADRGNTDALRQEQEYLRSAQNEREQSAKRQIAVNAALTTSSAILGVVQAIPGDPYTLAARVIAAVVAIGAGIASVSAASRNSTAGLASFKDGVVGLQGPGTGTSDSIHARLSKGESVITAAGTSRFPNLLTAINKKYDPIPALAKDLGFATSHGSGISRKEFAEYGKKLDEVVDAVKDNKVGVHTNITREGIYVATETQRRTEQRRYAG